MSNQSFTLIICGYSYFKIHCFRARTEVFLIYFNLRLRFVQEQRQPCKNNLIKIHKKTISRSKHHFERHKFCFYFLAPSLKKIPWQKRCMKRKKMNLAWMQTKDFCWQISLNKTKFFWLIGKVWICRLRTQFLTKSVRIL